LLKNVFGGCFDDGRFIVICAVYYLWCLYTVCNGALKKVGLRAPHSLSPVFFYERSTSATASWACNDIGCCMVYDAFSTFLPPFWRTTVYIKFNARSAGLTIACRNSHCEVAGSTLIGALGQVVHMLVPFCSPTSIVWYVPWSSAVGKVFR